MPRGRGPPCTAPPAPRAAIRRNLSPAGSVWGELTARAYEVRFADCEHWTQRFGQLGDGHHVSTKPNNPRCAGGACLGPAHSIPGPAACIPVKVSVISLLWSVESHELPNPPKRVRLFSLAH